jgi:hypothetical protein
MMVGYFIYLSVILQWYGTMGERSSIYPSLTAERLPHSNTAFKSVR